MSDWEIKAEDQSVSYFFKGLKSLWSLLSSRKKMLKQIMFWIFFTQLLDIIFPFFFKLIFDELPNVIAFGAVTEYMIFLVVAMFLINLGRDYLNKFTLEKTFLKEIIYFENQWPIEAHKKLLDLSLGYHEKENTGKKISKIDKGCEKMVDVCCCLRWGMLPRGIYLVLNLLFVLIIDWRLGLLFIAPFFPAAYMMYKAWKKHVNIWEEWEDKKEKASGIFCQSVLNVKTVQNYVQEQRESKGFSSIRRYMQKIDVQASHGIQKYFFFMNEILTVFFILTIFAGVYLAAIGQVTVGTVVFIIATGNVTFSSLWQLIDEYCLVTHKG